MDGIHTAIIGIGSLVMGDDAVGPRITEELRTIHTGRVQFYELNTPAYDLITYFHDYKNVIIIDAATFGASPGEIRRVQREEIIRWQPSAGTSMHDIDMISVIDYASQLDMLPENLILYCIQIASAEMSEQLTPAVEESIPRAVEMISADITAFKT